MQGIILATTFDCLQRLKSFVFNCDQSVYVIRCGELGGDATRQIIIPGCQQQGNDNSLRTIVSISKFDSWCITHATRKR